MRGLSGMSELDPSTMPSGAYTFLAAVRVGSWIKRALVMETTSETWPCYQCMGRYPVRMAVLDLDKPPAWWHEQAADHMTAAEARAYTGTDGERH